MPTRDPRIDAYVRKAGDFAQPLLIRFRDAVHQACPPVEETIKWGMPCFVYQGNLCHMAAFKQHCAFGFWKGSLLFPKDDPRQQEAMGHLGRVTSLREMPSAAKLKALVRQAMALNEGGVSAPARKRTVKKPLPEPPELTRALKGSAAARNTWTAFPPGHRREYIEWISEARREETRARRVATTIEWLAEGKSRNWKYQR
jgi:uncharacterized protein YdeI (YjbR/CyaY-like superfamily)